MVSKAGLDFETKVCVKEAAASYSVHSCPVRQLDPSYRAVRRHRPYQPAEAPFPPDPPPSGSGGGSPSTIRIITKNALVLRDLDLLRHMAADGLVHLSVSVTTLDADLARSLEPRTTTPVARLAAIAACPRRACRCACRGAGHSRTE